MFPFSFQRCGILGINSRNLDYLFPTNPRRLYRLADSKLETKKIAQSIGVAVPETYGVIRFQNEVKKLSNIVGKHKSFVIKPAQGSGGDGIVVIAEVTDKGYRKASGAILEPGDLQYQIYNILGGMFSLGGQTDVAIVEYAVQFDPVFAEIAYQGVPDIRVIVYHGVPAMAMLRLPTRASDGKANLHKGGVGVGIDLSTGKTLTSIHCDPKRSIRLYPSHREASSNRKSKIPGVSHLQPLCKRLYIRVRSEGKSNQTGICRPQT